MTFDTPGSVTWSPSTSSSGATSEFGELVTINSASTPGGPWGLSAINLSIPSIGGISKATDDMNISLAICLGTSTAPVGGSFGSCNLSGQTQLQVQVSATSNGSVESYSDECFVNGATVACTSALGTSVSLALPSALAGATVFAAETTVLEQL